jgi:O-antigen/teichoic acid export membrane protein
MNGAARKSVPDAPPLVLTAQSAAESRGETTRKHIRGSGLLLVGRAISLGLNLATQVVTARYLAKDDFGALAYGLAAVTLAASFVSLGLDKSARRFVAIYHEQRDFARLMGTMVLSIGITLALGLALVLTVLGLHDLLTGQVIGDQRSAAMLMILIALAPVEALNRFCDGVATAFAGARAIFVRRHVAGPALRLIVVLLLIAMQESVYFLAVGYLITGILGALLYFAYLVLLLNRIGVLQELRSQRSLIPAREVLGYSLPLLSCDVASAMRSFLAVCFLGWFYAPAAVAMFRVVVPLAGLNKVVFETFQILYTSHASRLYARQDFAAIGHLYWRTSLWISVLTFPVFLVTLVLAEPFTVLLLGEQYRASASVLAWLSAGFFFNAVLGFNTLTLKVFGDVRNIVRNDLLATAAAAGLYWWFVPRYGALGAAFAHCSVLVVHNLLNQAALLRVSGITFFPARYGSAYGAMLALTALLLGVQWLWPTPIYVGLGLAAVASAVLVLYARETLEVDTMFPELTRLPVVRRVFGFSNGVS